MYKLLFDLNFIVAHNLNSILVENLNLHFMTLYTIALFDSNRCQQVNNAESNSTSKFQVMILVLINQYKLYKKMNWMRAIKTVNEELTHLVRDLQLL
ncbi:hypothetical protein BLOT_003069 [Blomia tropicalis]|nr:hypothetical protein BLOT_003069 [Blomia tropicalis]